MLDDSDGFVSNFVGESISRRDGGKSQEKYCLTVLTFYKPWCSRHDLQQDKDTLEHDAFNAYPFTSCQQQIMDNFMIKYKCNNAQDDFAVQRKQKEKGLKMPLNLDREDIDDFDIRYYREDGDGYEKPTEAIITATKVFKQTSQTTPTRKARQDALAKTIYAIG